MRNFINGTFGGALFAAIFVVGILAFSGCARAEDSTITFRRAPWRDVAPPVIITVPQATDDERDTAERCPRERPGIRAAVDANQVECRKAAR